MSKMQAQSSLFIFENDALIEGFLTQLQNSQVRTVGPELIFGKIYDAIGFNAVQEDMFRHLVISPQVVVGRQNLRREIVGQATNNNTVPSLRLSLFIQFLNNGLKSVALKYFEPTALKLIRS